VFSGIGAGRFALRGNLRIAAQLSTETRVLWTKFNRFLRFAAQEARKQGKFASFCNCSKNRADVEESAVDFREPSSTEKR